MPNRQTLQHLLATLSPRKIREQHYIAQNTHPDGKRLYGGQVLAQVVQAATDTVDEGRRVHSQHAYFLRPGACDVPVTLDVEIARDGGSFSSRRVVASQNGKPILVSSLSFHIPETSDDYTPHMPNVPGPEGLKSERERELELDQLMPEFMITTGTDLDVRLVSPVNWANPQPREPILHAWMKTTGPVGDGAGLHESLLAYMSDALLIDVCLTPHGRHYLVDTQTASLDHALWFHAPFRADQWLLFTCECDHVGMARGLGRGRFYTREGRLVASCMQEGLMRPLPTT